jgi:hypothetical protein
MALRLQLHPQHASQPPRTLLHCWLRQFVSLQGF